MKVLSLLILLTVVLLTGCKSEQSAGSPGDVLKRYVEASQRQDIATMKSLLSKSSLELIEQSAQAQGTTLDELLRREASVKIQNAPETRSEKIEGDTATVEVKNETTGEFDLKMPFVKENGVWKLARDKFFEEAMKKVIEENNKKLSNSAPLNSNSSTNAAANK